MVAKIKGKLDSDDDKRRQDWRWRAVMLTRGNQTKTGTILIRILGKMTKNPPRFDINSTAHITAGGMWIADMQLRPDRPFLATAVGTVEDVTNAFRRLADALKLDDKDREEMFRLLRNWIGTDYRATSDPQVAEDRAKAARKGRLH